MWQWLSSRLRAEAAADGGRRHQSVSDRPPTPLPARRRRPPRPQRPLSDLPDLTLQTGNQQLPEGAFRVGPRPRIVHFDVEDNEEDAVLYEYFPPGAAVPPSRRQLFLSRARKPRSQPEPPSFQVQLAVAQIKAEIQAAENPPPSTWLGRVLEYYQEKRRHRRMYGKTGL